MRIKRETILLAGALAFLPMMLLCMQAKSSGGLLWQSIAIPFSLVWFLSLYWRFPSIAVANTLGLIGGVMNKAAIFANGGYMPVLGINKPDGQWVPMTEEHRLFWCCDILWGGSSIGDFILLVGIVAWPAMALARLSRRTSPPPRGGRE